MGIVNEVFIWSMKTPSGFPRLEVRSSLVDESITIFFLLEAATVGSLTLKLCFLMCKRIEIFRVKMENLTFFKLF
ncbi:hypothetical protein, partial [Vibrio cholerae]|uniref:hypothetical protein n=1 Tax=Vibrio cholerae TaxID=666 RepID=UPI001962CB6E